MFHVAATVRFDDPLKNAIITNTRGTREICQLALEMKKVQVNESQILPPEENLMLFFRLIDFRPRVDSL